MIAYSLPYYATIPTFCDTTRKLIPDPTPTTPQLAPYHPPPEVIPHGSVGQFFGVFFLIKTNNLFKQHQIGEKKCTASHKKFRDL